VTPKTIHDLVGRVMIDREFLEGLVRDPDGVLAAYELSADEHEAVVQALGRVTHATEEERAHVLESVMLKRWAT
jgi:hypothetical protein